MFKALWVKHWRQLRLFRWTAVGLGLLAPPLFLALAGASDRGWLFNSPTQTSAATIIREVLPVTYAIALWPLLAVMAAAQVLVSDRAGGTEAFLLERPVPRSRVWAARVLATLGTTLAITACHVLVWWLWARFLVGPSAVGEGEAVGRMFLWGAVALAVALPAGVAAAAFARTPIQSVLLALVLTAIPVAIGALFAGPVFWFCRLRGVPVFAGIPVLLLLGYFVGSFVMDCRGEPAGRGRLRRGAVVLAAAFLALPVVFAATAPFVLRWDARLALGNTTVVPAPSGHAALVVNNWQRAAWLIDTASRERLRFFPPPVYEVGWNEDGSRLALIHGAGVAGRMLQDPRLDVFDTAGRRKHTTVVCEECLPWWSDSCYWVGERIVLPALVEGRETILIIDPSTGERQTVEIPPSIRSWAILRPSAEGSPYVLGSRPPEAADEAPRAGRQVGRTALYRLDVDRASLGESIELPDDEGSRWLAQRALSPSGRRWFVQSRPDGEARRILDLDTGETTDLPSVQAVWLAGDRPAWLERTDEESFDLFAGEPGIARAVASLPGRPWLWPQPSPDRSRLLFSAQLPGDEPVTRYWVYEPDGGGLQEVLATTGTGKIGTVQWAGRDTLALVEPGALALLDARSPGEPVYVIGGPSR
jgi:hypothetical protein